MRRGADPALGCGLSEIRDLQKSEEAVRRLRGAARKVGDRGTGPDINPSLELHLSELPPNLECDDFGGPVDLLPGAPG